MRLGKAMELLDRCLLDMEYVGAIRLIFGVTDEEDPTFLMMVKFLSQLRHTCQAGIRAAKRHDLTAHGTAELGAACEEAARVTRANKLLWKNGFAPVLCSDADLKKIALEIREQGSIALTKREIDERFDFSRIVSAWDHVPHYTKVSLGMGIRMSSPEFDAFEAMCWFHDEAIRTQEEVVRERTRLNREELDGSEYFEALGKHGIARRQAVINAWLVVEAYMNGLASAFLEMKRPSLDEATILSLSELVKDKSGRTRRQYIGLPDKLYEWVRIMSPRGETFDRGQNPYQTFMKVRDARDSLVHLSENKVSRYWAIDVDFVKRAAMTAVEIMEGVSKFLTVDGGQVAYPFWLKRPGKDGLFRLTRTVELKPVAGQVRTSPSSSPPSSNRSSR